MTSSDRPLQLIEELESFAPHMIREPGVDDAPAGDTGITAMLVRAMRDEHRNLVGRVGELRVEQSPEVWRVQIGRTSDATVDPPERFCDGCKAAGGSGTTARQP